MVVFIFSMSDKNSKERLFGEIFLLADVKPNIFFEMLFLTISNIDIGFQA